MSLENAYLGDVPFEADGKTYTLRFDWAALAACQTQFKDVNPFTIVADRANLEAIAEVTAIGLQVHHPGITAAQIQAMSPAVFVLGEALSDALNYAYWGPSKKSPPVEATNGADKSDPMTPEQPTTGSPVASGKRSKRASRRASSGA